MKKLLVVSSLIGILLMSGCESKEVQPSQSNLRIEGETSQVVKPQVATFLPGGEIKITESIGVYSYWRFGGVVSQDRFEIIFTKIASHMAYSEHYYFSTKVGTDVVLPHSNFVMSVDSADYEKNQVTLKQIR